MCSARPRNTGSMRQRRTYHGFPKTSSNTHLGLCSDADAAQHLRDISGDVEGLADLEAIDEQEVDDEYIVAEGEYDAQQVLTGLSVNTMFVPHPIPALANWRDLLRIP